MKKGSGRKRKGPKAGKAVHASPRPSGRSAAARSGLPKLDVRPKLYSGPFGRAPSLLSWRHGAVQALAERYSQDDRLSLAMLMGPFVIVSAMLAGQHAMKTAPLAIDKPFIVPQPPSATAPPEAFPPVTGDGFATVPPSEQPRRSLVRRPALPMLSPLVKPGEAVAILGGPSAPAPRLLGQPISPPGAICEPMPDLAARAQRRIAASFPSGVKPETFGRALAQAAAAQLDDVVIYNPRYARVRFPNGDVSALYGVCTDVVVRAYRALGIDLQALVQQTRSGRGDTNIDHRRVDVLRKFFAKYGERLPISDLADDYVPGDIVTYYRPQNRVSTSHIAIVTDQRAPSGRLMILHNRGWGPQLEDALFVDKITGHYRYSGPAERPATANDSPDRQRQHTTQTAAVSDRAPAGSADRRRP